LQDNRDGRELTWLARKSQSSALQIFNIAHLTYIRMQKKHQVMTSGTIQLITSPGPAPSLMYFTIPMAG
jgi:hypothetical protein